MYSLVRLNGVISISFGLVLIGLGIAVMIVGATYNQELVELANASFMVGTGYRLLDTRFYSIPLGVILFLAGLSVSSNGQLLISFANTSSNTSAILEVLREAVKSNKPSVVNHINVNTEEAKGQENPVVVTTTSPES